jgi:hypothetical protein
MLIVPRDVNVLRTKLWERNSRNVQASSRLFLGCHQLSNPQAPRATRTRIFFAPSVSTMFHARTTYAVRSVTGSILDLGWRRGVGGDLQFFWEITENHVA